MVPVIGGEIDHKSFFVLYVCYHYYEAIIHNIALKFLTTNLCSVTMDCLNFHKI